jgi:hypothetical protein
MQFIRHGNGCIRSEHPFNGWLFYPLLPISPHMHKREVYDKSQWAHFMHPENIFGKLL